MRLYAAFALYLLCLITEASSYVIRDYFDGFNWKLGPFVFEVEEDRIKSIRGPLKQQQMRALEHRSSHPTKRNRVYFYPQLDLIPGLVDSHIHLSFLDPSIDNSHDQAIKNMQNDDRESLKLALTRLKQATNRGFLTLRDLGGNPRVLEKIRKKTKESPAQYPNFYSIRSAFAAANGQCPPKVNCNNSFTKIPLPPAVLQKAFTKGDPRIHYKIFLDNDPYLGTLKKSHVIEVLQKAKSFNASLAIHTIKQKDFSWLIPSLYPQVSLEHLHSFSVPELKKRGLEKKFKKTGVRLIPSLYSSSYRQVLKSKKILPNSYSWERLLQLRTLNSLSQFTDLLCFGSDFYFPTYSPLRDNFYYAIEIMKDMANESFLSKNQVLSMATGGCNPLFPGTSIGLIKKGATASFNLVGGDLKSNINDLHDIRGTVHKGQILRLEGL